MKQAYLYQMCKINIKNKYFEPQVYKQTGKPRVLSPSKSPNRDVLKT